MSRLTILLLTACGCLVATRASAQPPAPDPAQLLAVAANGYRANLEAFEYVTCRYTVTWGFARSLDDAIAGKLEPGSRTATAVFYKDGRTLRFRIEEDAATKATLDKPPRPENTPEIPGLKGGPLVPFMTTDYLLNGTQGLLFNPRGRTANVYDQGARKYVDAYFLLAMLQVNTEDDFGLRADQAARGEVRFSTEPAPEEGRIRTTFHLPKDPTVVYTIDLTRGSLPTRIEMLYEKGTSGSYLVVPQIRACSKGRWFPERIVTFMKQSPTQSPCLIKDFRVVELDVDRRPPRDALTIDLPAGTSVNQLDEPRKYFRTRRAERIGPEDLARIAQLTEEVPRNPQTDTTIVLPRSYTWVWYAVAAAIGLPVAAYFGRRYLTSRRGHAVP
jgi:hypothetical protein